MNSIKHTAMTVALCLAATASWADGWTLNNDASNLSFGSIKKDTVGESHRFETLSGTVSADGAVAIDVDLTSLETFIDIRNERMAEHVFKGLASASLAADLDMSEFEALGVGQNMVTYVDVTLGLVGTEYELDAEVFVVRISDTQIMITTNELVFVSTEDLGIDAGIDKLMALAELPGITRSVPLSIRLVFDADGSQA